MTPAKILILGGYGNFGARIAERLAGEQDLQLVISGRSEEKCRQLAAGYAAAPHPPLVRAFDIGTGLEDALDALKPAVVVHTAGPFQGQGYHVAEACIAAGCHYVDLADGRDFVAGIARLDAAAKEKGVAVISGASSVPCLTAAIVDHYLPRFGRLTALDYAITTAQRDNIGEATVAAALSCAGRPIRTIIGGKDATVYGWQDLQIREYPDLGRRLIANCDVPDLSIFPERYKTLETIRFRGGLEFMLPQLGLWALSWLARAGLARDLAGQARRLMGIARLWERLSSSRSALHMTLSGTAPDGAAKSLTFHIIAKSEHGPYIPCIPAILTARMLARDELARRGAFPCVGMIALEPYIGALRGLDIRTAEA